MNSEYWPSTATVHLSNGDVQYAAMLPSGPIVVLDGIAGLIWSEVCAGPYSSVVDRVAAATGTAPDQIRMDVERFLTELIELGLLRSVHE